jgi:hypothetical protein
VQVSSPQTSLGKDLSSGGSRSCVSHNVSSAGSSKLLQEHAKATAVAFASDPTSSHARSLRISSTWRHAYIDSGARLTHVSTVLRDLKPHRFRQVSHVDVIV